MDLSTLMAALNQQVQPGFKEEHVRKANDFDSLKDIGNQCFRKQNYEIALKAYAKAAKMARNCYHSLTFTTESQTISNLLIHSTSDDLESSTIASNSSTCYAAIGEFQDALTQANIAIKHRPTWEKAYLRKISALIALEKVDEAEKMMIEERYEIFPVLKYLISSESSKSDVAKKGGEIELLDKILGVKSNSNSSSDSKSVTESENKGGNGDGSKETEDSSTVPSPTKQQLDSALILIEDLKNLGSLLQIAKIPWIKLEENVFIKYLGPEGPRKEADSSESEASLSQDLDESLVLDDLDHVWYHYRIIHLKTREISHSSRMVYSLPGFGAGGGGSESKNAEPQRIILGEYENCDIIEMGLKRLRNGEECRIKVTGPSSYYPTLENPLEFQLESFKHERALKVSTLIPSLIPTNSPTPIVSSKPESVQTIFQSILQESRRGQGILNGALQGKEKLDSFDRNKAAASQQETDALDAAWSVKKGGVVATRRFKRALEFLSRLKECYLNQDSTDSSETGTATSTKVKWIEDENLNPSQKQRLIDDLESETFRCHLGLSRALTVSQHIFQVEKGDQGDFGKDLLTFLQNKGIKNSAELEVNAKGELDEALSEASVASDLAIEKWSKAVSDLESSSNTNSTSIPDHIIENAILSQVAKAEVHTARNELEKAMECLDLGTKINPKDERIRSERARLNLKTKKAETDNSEVVVSDWKLKFDVEIEKGNTKEEGTKGEINITWLKETMIELGHMCDGNRIAWDALMKTKIGKSVGLIQKAEWADAEMKDLCTKLVRKFRDMAERNRPLWA